MERIGLDKLDSLLMNKIPSDKENATPSIILIDSTRDLNFTADLPLIYTACNNLGWQIFECELHEPNSNDVLFPIINFFAEVFALEEAVLIENAKKQENERLMQIGDYLIPDFFMNLPYIQELFRTISNSHGKQIRDLNSLEMFDLIRTINSIFDFIIHDLFQNHGLIFYIQKMHYIDTTTLSWLRVLFESNMKMPFLLIGNYDDDLVVNKMSYTRITEIEPQYPNFTIYHLDSENNLDRSTSRSGKENQIETENNQKSQISIPHNEGQQRPKLRPIEISETETQVIGKIDPNAQPLSSTTALKKNLSQNPFFTPKENQDPILSASPKPKPIEISPDVVEKIDEVTKRQHKRMKGIAPLFLQHAKTPLETPIDNPLFQKAFGYVFDPAINDLLDDPISHEASELAKESEVLFQHLKEIGEISKNQPDT